MTITHDIPRRTTRLAALPQTHAAAIHGGQDGRIFHCADKSASSGALMNVLRSAGYLKIGLDGCETT